LKLKNKLIISYSLIITAILASGLYFSDNVLKSSFIVSKEISRNEIEKLVAGNNLITKRLLKELGERLVVMQSHLAALQLKIELNKLKDIYDYNSLRENPAIRRTAARSIEIPFENTKIKAGYIDLLDDKGVAVIHPNKSVEGRNYSEWKRKYPEMYKLVERAFREDSVSGYYSFLNKKKQSVKKFMALKKIPDTPFIVCASVEIDKYFTPLLLKIRNKTEKHKKVIESKMLKQVDDAVWHTQIAEISGGIILLILGISIALWQSHSIDAPIQKLCREVRKMGQGDFKLKLPEKGSGEIFELSRAFNRLAAELEEYMDNLKKEINSRQAIETEIAITRQIQEALLPHTFPPFPNRSEFQLYASLIPAKEVSGDFYDFFFTDENTLALVIADVSGKGLPASLFMAVSRTLLRNLCLNANLKSPSEILRRANNYLCESNDTCMFVTAFLAFYNIKTGRITYSNAGHNEIVSWKNEDRAKLFGAFANPPLGVLEECVFTEESYDTDIGETLVFYTDGITEAIDPEKNLFGTERFISLLTRNKPGTPLHEIVENLNDELDKFQAGNRFDDVTIMLFRRNS
jgi:sigma-B regulation protein RsbU (phosphoserine phosphatase)